MLREHKVTAALLTVTNMRAYSSANQRSQASVMPLSAYSHFGLGVGILVY